MDIENIKKSVFHIGIVEKSLLSKKTGSKTVILNEKPMGETIPAAH